ncbi:MAG: dihydroorotase [Candidatus Obscuribacterales bacterium]|nr:dihydroorotase [Candidatus Obscuribacterales bacterium]
MTLIQGMLLKNTLAIDPSRHLESQCDIRISGDEIIEHGKNLSASPGEETIDCTGLWVVPGMIDLHTHMRDLGQKDKEDLHTGSRAAAAGGFTTVVAMANTEPPLDSGMVLSMYLQRIKDNAVIDVLPVACVTKGMKGEELTNMVELAEMGAIAFSDDGVTIQNMSVLRRAMEYVQLTGKTIISHAEDKDMVEGGVITEGIVSTRMGLQGRPAAAEAVAVARELELVRLINVPYHFTHLTTARAVELIRQAKSEGLPVTADVTPHHISLSVDAICHYDTNLKMNPPLRLELDRKALIEGLIDGTIDAIATDHAPHTRLEKSGMFAECPVGMIGLETAFAVCGHELLETLGRLKFFSLFTINPARILDLPESTIRASSPATFTVIDPKAEWVYDPTRGASRSSNSPYKNRKFTGKVVMTVNKGNRVYEDLAFKEKRLALTH